MIIPAETKDEFQAGIKWGQEHPVEWAEKALGVKLDPKQKEYLLSLRDHERTDFKTGNNVGKTFSLAVGALWFLYNFIPSTIIVTATTDRQLFHQFFPELKTLYLNAKWKLPGRIIARFLEVDPDVKWFLLGFSTSEEAKFEGFHNKNILLIMDESKGIKDSIWRGGERLFRGENEFHRWVAAGTPEIAPIGEFAEISLNPRKAKLWNHVTCSGWDSPRVSNKKCQEALDVYGENNPFYISMVLGQVPMSSENSLIDLNDVTRAMAREIGYGEHIDEVSCDVARKGIDETVISYRCGWKVFQLVHKGKDTIPGCVSRIKKLLFGQKDAHEIPIRIDDIGVGGGVTDVLEAEGYYVVPINVARVAARSDIYYDLGTEIYAQLGEALKSKPISIPDDPELKSQIFQRTDTRLKNKGNKLVLKLPSKEDLRKDPLHKGNPSPDRSDSLAMLLCEIPPPESNKDDGKRTGGTVLCRKGSGGWTGKKSARKSKPDDSIPGMRVGRRRR